MDPGQLAKMIDLTLLKPTATAEEVKMLCKEARKYGFICVVVHSHYVPLACKLLQGTEIKVGTVVGFPFGANLSEVKAYEARRAVELGASEIDIVINPGALKSKDLATLEYDIKSVVEEVKSVRSDAIVRVIIETCYLSDEEKVEACRAVVNGGADFVKTSTGFGSGEATVRDARLIRSVVRPKFGVKATGGIRNLEIALAMIEACVNRISASAGGKIVGELIDRSALT
ncbi:MAG: deoxyribose-phosphate aldolase [archaeon GB-1867-005]|nr:deoxyribose-phosphate aldolase [Candidatus Culexmicrobium cathedralense]